jgi:flagellar basal body rod protein FlgB
MNIGTNSALNGLRSVTQLQDITAHNVANSNTPSYTAKEGLQSESPNSGPVISTIRDTGEGTDLAKSMVELKQNKNMYSADLKILKIQDRMIGELIDLIA